MESKPYDERVTTTFEAIEETMEAQKRTLQENFNAFILSFQEYIYKDALDFDKL